MLESEETTSEATEPGEARQSAEKRKATLERQLRPYAAQQWRIETRSDFQATIAKGERVHHTLHLILTILTMVWGIVWAWLVVFRGIERRMITVDEYGNVVDTSIGGRDRERKAGTVEPATRAKEILAERYARGEIGRDEYREKLSDLQ